jgi:hypothetical protein
MYRKEMALLEAFDIEMKKKSDIEIDHSILSTPYHGIAVSEVIRQYLAANQKGTHAKYCLITSETAIP